MTTPRRIIAELHRAYKAQVGGEWFDFEQVVREVYRSVLQPGDVAVDAGANFGSHTVQMAECVGESGLVLAVEAVPAVAARLREIIRDGYGHLERRVEVVNKAVGDTPGVTSLYVTPENASLSSLQNRPHVDLPKEVIDIEVVRLDDLLAGRSAAYMKLDVEGAELATLRGAERSLRVGRPVVTFEYDTATSACFGHGPDALLKFFVAQEYTIHDPFGFEMRSPEDFAASMVWDYIALGGGEEQRRHVLNRVANYVATNFGVYPTTEAQN